MKYLTPAVSQMPDRSGLPSAVFGAGADRFGFPSGVRGTPGVGEFSHCAESGTHVERRTTKVRIYLKFSMLASSSKQVYTLLLNVEALGPPSDLNPTKASSNNK